MNKAKIVKVMEVYEQKINHLFKSSAWRDNEKIIHVSYMLDQMRVFASDDRTDKLYRWLGFVQGVLWCEGVYTITEMKNHNRPTKEEVWEEYKGHTLDQTEPCSACDDYSGCRKWKKLAEATDA